MSAVGKPLLIGKTPLKKEIKEVGGEFVTLFGEQYYKIRNFDALEPFFMSIVSSSNHWLFIASTGGLSAGRINSEQALFPYYTVDKLTENNENTGSKTILLVTRDGATSIWEPLSACTGSYKVERNIFKNLSGTAVVFEEINHDLGLGFRYAWRTGDTYGFVRTAWLNNYGSNPCQVEILDGIQNILPANVSSTTQNIYSNLLDAYKRSELEPETGLGIFTLNATMTDLAEPSESLLATITAQAGLEPLGYLLCSEQLESFQSGHGISTEREVRGQRGAYLVHARVELKAGEERSWYLFADVNLDHSQIIKRKTEIQAEKDGIVKKIEQDIADNQANLAKLVAAADGVQLTTDHLSSAHHFANVMFNIMRGGIFADQYQVQTHEFKKYIGLHMPKLFTELAGFFEELPQTLPIGELQAQANGTGSRDLIRLCASYLPLTFSRRHGDPSRPWNRFQINIKNSDGSQRFDYEGNWRDIFQNWEALAWSYPEFVESMLATFLNATTVDGYNPYRVTYGGIDWEHPEPGNPWANIGYWSDHQIIYLQKLMEISARVHPGKLQSYLDSALFSYANVPYRIKPYESLLHDAYNTIDFDWKLHENVTARVKEMGTDARLVSDEQGSVIHANLTEKLLTLLLAKLANFVPEGGIWMSTQRPEWNDANNALVGKGLSVVTLCYLRRFLVFCRDLFKDSSVQSVAVREEVASFSRQVRDVLQRYQPILAGSFTDEQRKNMLDDLGQAGSIYRCAYYDRGLTGRIETLPVEEIATLLELAQAFVDHSLRANRRTDHMYHSYNTLEIKTDRVQVNNLYEMLEGQVAALSSGLLTSAEALDVLKSIKSSRIYQAERHSYILYPDREVHGFLQKNTITPDKLTHLELVKALKESGDTSLLVMDIEGNFHFNGHIRNIKGVNEALADLKNKPGLAIWVEPDGDTIRALFEEIFQHAEFTGRSSTFFAYEGLGSIYWHMVSKLLLAAGEYAVRARNEEPTSSIMHSLAEKYLDIRAGLGFHKTPREFGSFPMDPYSHSPKNRGAKQPGMTGQVKEEILSRMMEVGFFVNEGQIRFDPFLLEPQELLSKPCPFTWIDTHGNRQTLEAPPGSLIYTICQVPVVLRASNETSIEIHKVDGSMKKITGSTIDLENSRHIFGRDGVIRHVILYVIMPKLGSNPNL